MDESRITDPRDLMKPDQVTYDCHGLPGLYEACKEQAVYLVAVSYAPGNPVHEAVMLTGFKNGAYWQLCSTGYEAPASLHDIHALQIIKELHVSDRKGRW